MRPEVPPRARLLAQIKGLDRQELRIRTRITWRYIIFANNSSGSLKGELLPGRAEEVPISVKSGL
jgi:hypothetical protein